LISEFNFLPSFGKPENNFNYFPVIENKNVNNLDVFQKLHFLVEQLGINIHSVSSSYFVCNESVKAKFYSFFSELHSKQKSNPSLYKKEDWIQESNQAQRFEYINYFASHISKFRTFGWNDGQKVFFLIFFFIFFLISFHFFIYLLKKNYN